MGKAQKPIVNAMLICDRIITEAGTNKKSLIGIFENISAYKFPCVHHFLAVYIKLTDARGEYKFRLELGDLENDGIIGRAEIPKPIKVENPLAIHDLVFNLAGIKLMHQGKYEFRIFANDEVFGQKTFLVNQIKENRNEG
ncbi:MAG: hypothetical protein ABIH85_04605 [Candidatus Omnitrophota bacterium]|nr:hypothetical protein [Candidatus Omnitrophota bacterium]MBU1894303.1 hypothetical protein [Candidatus Omnitrophota bacterium]